MCFNGLFNDGLGQVICIASFSFNLNFEELESTIWKQSGVLGLLELWILLKFLNICDNLSFSKCSLILVDKWQVVSPILVALQPGHPNL